MRAHPASPDRALRRGAPPAASPAPFDRLRGEGQKIYQLTVMFESRISIWNGKLFTKNILDYSGKQKYERQT